MDAVRLTSLPSDSVLELHDAPVGPLIRCQITGSEEMFEIIDLGHQPPCDSLLSQEDLLFGELTYPLRYNICPDSGLAQIGFVVPQEEVYPENYPYRAGISAPLVEYQSAFAETVSSRFQGTAPSPLVVDIGSNDGTLLKAFKNKGCRALGVEPTGIAEIAERENGVVTLQAPFTEALAKDIVVAYGRARIITSTNSFAHMASLGEVMRGILVLLEKNGGVFVMESHYLLDIFERNQFDSMYHEHIRTYSLRALCTLFEMYGLEVFDVERGSRYAGNIRVFVTWKGQHAVEDRVRELLLLEVQQQLFSPERWKEWRSRVLRERSAMMEWLHDCRQKELRVVGCSAPGRASTLLNFYGIDSSLVPYLGELRDSLKLGKFTPRSHIPIVPNSRFKEEVDLYAIVLFSWHYADFIIRRLREEGLSCRLVLPLPHFRII